MDENIDASLDGPMDPSLGNMQMPSEMPAYQPRQLSGSRRAGIRYKAYSTEDFERAIKAVKEEGISLRKASMTYNVPKTTLAEKLGDSCPNLPPLQASRKNRIATRYTWTEADMEQAVAAVHAGTHASEAARQFGVPYSNLNSRTRGRPPRELKAELARLSLKQESLMVDWAHAQCELGFPPTKDQVYDLAQKVLAKSGTDQKLGRQWVGHWLRRHPHIKVLEWAPKQKADKKLPPPFVASTFAPQTLAQAPVTEDSFIHETGHLGDDTLGHSVAGSNADMVGLDQGMGEVASLIIQT
ncbi:hypothetical protein JX265_001083 [Neoarthrinium moseri]|uniref:HTH CENPB-type domain-containing protein n=1 Tax=Neoarthrinium moseri TaxID=1658444 RepID=A0A9P9WX09_9PEZI|nr:uncharacterized protein JN550_004645 [Neoarthrinium moseri]KAI1871200.1 hypothetical protein JN550_004645 [Neoarthrinium moseri]KAI1880843.1 hypothetical protein JX265_001083 [Neoarthrinium moseri]